MPSNHTQSIKDPKHIEYLALLGALMKPEQPMTHAHSKHD